MKATIPRPVHASYQRHRRQLALQIILPVVLFAILIVGLIMFLNIATFRDGGDVGRWSAISTIWIVIPIMIAGFIFLALLTGIIYLLKRLLQITPLYTGQAQDFVRKIAIRIRRAADASVKPVIFLDSIGAMIKRLLGRK